MSEQQQTQQQQVARKQHEYHESSKQYVATVYQTQHFPKWKYRKGHNPILVLDAKEEKNLGPEWQDERIEDEEQKVAAADPGAMSREMEELKKEVEELKKNQKRTVRKRGRPKKQAEISAATAGEEPSSAKEESSEKSSSL